jgi:hypothetical protein
MREIRTQGEIESAICALMVRFEQEDMGRGPKDVRAHLINDLLVVRLSGVSPRPSSTWPSRCRPRRAGTCCNRSAPT